MQLKINKKKYSLNKASGGNEVVVAAPGQVQLDEVSTIER